MKRAKFFLTGMFILIILLTVFLLIFTETKLFLFLYIIFLLSLIFTRFIETKLINRKVKSYIDNNNYDGATEYLNQKIEKCFFPANVYLAVASLVFVYMMLGKTVKAKYLIEKYQKLKNYKYLYYIQMIILIAENKLFEARYYQEKLLKLRSKIFAEQQESAIQIFEMIDTEEFNQSLYEKTKFPLLKSICLKYSDKEGEQIEILTAEDLNFNQFIPAPQNNVIVRTISILLIVLTPISLIGAMILSALRTQQYDSITTIDGGYYFLKSIWILWLFLPITLACLIFGLVVKKKNYQTTGNIVVGAIFSTLLILFGSTHFLILNHFKTDPKYLHKIEATIQVDFPKSFRIVTEDNTKGKQVTKDKLYYKYKSVVRFLDEEEVLIFENNLNEDYWVDSFSEKTEELLSKIFLIETSSYDKFLLYCYESNEYNPESFISEYNYICIGYSKKHKSLIIYEYAVK